MQGLKSNINRSDLPISCWYFINNWLLQNNFASIVKTIAVIAFCMGYTTLFSQVQADFSASVVSGCSPIMVTFKNLSTSSTSWHWDLGNGTVSILKNPSIIYMAAGTYNVKLIASNGTLNNTVTKTGYINVYANPDVDFGITQLLGCFPLAATFGNKSKAGSGTISSWQWDFGDGSISNVQNPAHSFTNIGKFNISLTLKNSVGCLQTLSKPNFITVIGPVHAYFSFSTPPPCNIPATVQFTDYSTGDSIVSRSWDFGDGQTTNSINPSHVYLAKGSYTVTHKDVNVRGCFDVVSAQINIGIVNADFYLAVSSCNNVVSLANTSTPAGSLKNSYWAFDDGTTDSVTNPQKTFSSPGLHSVTLKADFGGCSSTITKNITVLSNPVPSFTASIPATCSPALTTTFTNTTAGNTVVKWRFGDGYSSELAQPTHTFTDAGDYLVRLTTVNANGCVGTTFIPAFIHIGGPKITQIIGPPYEGCIPYMASFSAVVAPANEAVTYKWDFGDGTTSNQITPSHNYTVEGNYDVVLTITAVNGGCTDVMRMASAVLVGIKPQANFFASPLVICSGANVSFVDSSSGSPQKYHWDFGDGDSSISIVKNPIKVYKIPGYKTITLTVSRNGCADNITRQDYVFVKPPSSPFKDVVDCNNQNQHYFSAFSATATTFKWNFGDGDSSSLQNPAHVYKDTGSYHVTMSVNAGECAYGARNVFVLNEKASFNSVGSIGCGATGKVFKTTSNPNHISSYLWYFGDADTVLSFNADSIPHNYDTTGTYKVKLEITDLNLCKNNITKPVLVSKYGPKANFNPTKVCIDVLTQFNDQSTDLTSKIVKWVWDFDDNSGLQSFSQSPFGHTYKIAATYSISLQVTDALGCSDTLYKPNAVTVQSPKAIFGASNTVYCLNSGLQFYNFSQGYIGGWQWAFGDGATSTDINPTHAYTKKGVYDVKLSVTDNIGCKTDTTIPSFVNIINSSALFSIDDSVSTCPPLISAFTNQSINMANAKWDFGDGNTSTLINCSHIYTLPGVYNVQLVSTGNGGCMDTLVKKIKIAGPYGAFSYNPNNWCAPLLVSFTSQAVNATSYLWDFNNGITDSTTTFTTQHGYPTMGTYLPKLVLQDSVGCKVPIYGKENIQVKGINTHIKSLGQSLFCDSATVTFIDSTETNDTVNSYQWSFGDGQSSTVFNPDHNYLLPGTYKVNYKITTASGCVSSDSLKLPIKVVASPSISFSSPYQLCMPDGVKLAGQLLKTDTSTIRWAWDFGNGQTSSLQSPAEQHYDTSGQYNITSIATNSSGCFGTAQHSLKVFALPVLTISPSKFICPGGQYTLAISGALNYAWDEEASLSCSTCANPVAKPAFDQMYKVVGTDVHGCQAAGSVLVKVKQPFTMVVGNGATLCFGQSYGLHAIGAEAYIWSPNKSINNASIGSPIVTPSTSTNYRVIGYDTVGCLRDTGYITIKVYPIPTIDILERETTVPVGSTIQLHTTVSSDVTKLHWEPATGLSCTNCPNPSATPKQDIVYSLVGTNDGGCTAQDNVDILVVCNNGNIFIPTTFSPNGDGVNDVFYPRGRGIYGIKGMRVFSKWGEMLYERTNFQANDIASGWDGRYKGQLLSSDVYVYMIDVICDNNKVFTLKGNVTLLR